MNVENKNGQPVATDMPELTDEQKQRLAEAVDDPTIAGLQANLANLNPDQAAKLAQYNQGSEIPTDSTS